MNKKVNIRNPKYATALALFVCLATYMCVPPTLFDDPYSTIVNDDEGNLIGAKIAGDGQWRFPEIDSVPLFFEQAIITLEDERFYYHPGIDPISLVRALGQNIKSGSIVSGASTITMQIARMSRKGKKRTYLNKMIETFLALRIEIAHSKIDILKTYVSHAPFGGNVVGLEAASWRYFNKSPNLLSLAESAMLAVLPNAPSLVHLSKNRPKLLSKRNQLLLKMKEKGLVSQDDYDLALLENIPPAPYTLPRLAPHFMEFVHATAPEAVVQSTLNRNIQNLANNIANTHLLVNQQSEIHNVAILILDTRSGKVLAYVGNAPLATHESAVDMVQGNRSSGSILKPFLFACMLEEGLILPGTMIKDTPVKIDGYQPQNYDRTFSGASQANIALAQSLNVPAVNMLQKYGVNIFLNKLKSIGFSSLSKGADHYGLSLILGGGEVNLYQLTGAYASLGRVLMRFNQDKEYAQNDYFLPIYDRGGKGDFISDVSSYPSVLSAGSIYHTFQALKEVNRPDEEGGWQSFSSSSPIAWKTGTSFGHRDAWAVGLTPQYTIGVWVGNADGEPRNGLVGVRKAGPILFDLFNSLPRGHFFQEPIDDLIPLDVCTRSGMIRGPHCDISDTIYVPMNGQKSGMCPYHKQIHIDNDGYQVNNTCLSVSDMVSASWFELPPAMAHYYRMHHPEYKSLPSFRPGCISEDDSDPMEFIYPSGNTSIYLPVNRDGQVEKVVFKSTHTDPSIKIFWHIDDEYIGETQELHDMAIYTSPGHHVITLVDEAGRVKSQFFKVIGEKL